MKYRLVRFVQNYLLNPPNRLLLALKILPAGRASLETIGCKTGKRRRTPVGDGWVGNQFWIVAEHGMKAGYVRNIACNPRVRVMFRGEGGVQWHNGTAVLMPDDDPRERQRWLAKNHPGSATNAAIVRLLGTNLLTVRIDLD
jgi:deazaflavin-dependent oxidoreductase (nitroreductase family)